MRILVRGTNWIGDAVMTIPASRKLRTLFPGAEITLQTRPWAEEIFRQTHLFDEIITPGPLSHQIRTLRARRFDLALIFPNSFSAAMAIRLGGAKRRFGYGAERRSFLLTDVVNTPVWKNTRHEVFYYLELVNAVEKEFFGQITETLDLEPRIDISDASRTAARESLREAGIDAKFPVVALAPGSTNSEAKRWHPESFARLNDLLQSELKANVVLVGAKDEADISRRVSSVSKHTPVDLTGTTDLTGAAAILSEVDLLISNDMGLAHLAPAVGTETIVIFGPTNQLTTRPFSEKAAVISANVECSPCMLRRCPIDHRCMTRVSAEEVFALSKDKLCSMVLGSFRL
jgi:heptosyltransferase-2